ncbi:MAG: hypothetical protein ACOC10_07550 [Bacteroidota bacterium]
MKDYPYDKDSFTALWLQEGKHLGNALAEENMERIVAYADSFLMVRDKRRAESNLQSPQVEAEKSLEWLEGMAKYTEYTSYKMALNMDNTPYTFKEKNAYWQLEQTQQLKKLGKQSGDQRFYHSGCAMAMILDKLNPAWRAKIMADGVFLEDLLREKV